MAEATTTPEARELRNKLIVQRRLAQQAADLLEMRGLLRACLAYIDTTWGPEDDLPEPAEAQRARAFLTRMPGQQDCVAVPVEDLGTLKAAARHAVEDWRSLADDAWDDRDRRSDAYYTEEADATQAVLDRLDAQGAEA